MTSPSPFSRLPAQTLLAALSCLLVLQPPSSSCAQEPSKPLFVRRTANFIFLVIGYEMDKQRANAIVQTQDMTSSTRAVVEKLEALARTGAVIHASCSAQSLQAGYKLAVEAGTVAYEFDKAGVSASAENMAVTIKRTEKSSGVTSTINASFEPGGYAFIGTVPDTKPGKDQLLFIRCLVNYP